MRRVLLALAMLALFSTTAPAGPNAQGAIVVHTNDAYDYLSTTVCTTTLGQPATCEEAIVRTDKETNAVVWFLAAFLPTANPRVAAISFGINFDDMNLDPSTEFGFCGPAGTVEAPDDGWPSNTAGTAIGFGTPIIGNTLFRFYYFKVDEFSGLPGPFLCSTINPTGGFAAFFDDNLPPAQDNITMFGCVRWYAEGQRPCDWPPGPPTGACCLSTGACVVLNAADCADQGVYYVGDGTDCVPPNPWCAQPGACCDLQTGACAFVLEAECLAPMVFLGGDCLSNNPCPQMGACCEPVTGACTYVLAAACLTPNVWHGELTCDPNLCPVEPLGACCTVTGSCTMTFAAQCVAPSIWQVEWTCEPNFCSFEPVGACCFCEGYCAMLTQADCIARGGILIGWTDCELAFCAPPPPGACCLGQECLITNEWCCTLQSGTFMGSDTACNSNPCEGTHVKDTTWGRIKATFH